MYHNRTNVYGEIRILSKDIGEYVLNNHQVDVCKYWGSVQCIIPGGEAKGGVFMLNDCIVHNSDSNSYRPIGVQLVQSEAHPEVHKRAKQGMGYFYYSDLEGKEFGGLFVSNSGIKNLHFALSRQEYDMLDVTECNNLKKEVFSSAFHGGGAKEEGIQEVQEQITQEAVKKPFHFQINEYIGILICIFVLSFVFWLLRKFYKKHKKTSL